MGRGFREVFFGTSSTGNSGRNMNKYELALVLLVLVPALIIGVYYYIDWVNNRTVRKFKRRRGDNSVEKTRPVVESLAQTGVEWWEGKTGKSKDE